MIQNTFELQQILCDPGLDDHQKAELIGISTEEFRRQHTVLSEGRVVPNATSIKEIDNGR